MAKNLITDKRFLLALSIVNGALDDWTEERRTAMILEITKIKESFLRDSHPTESDRKNTKKVSK
jgi:hypothetical protein